MSWPRSPFGVDWDDLSLADVKAFLGREPAPREGQRWEAKGLGGNVNAKPAELATTWIHDALSSFGNSFDGGYLVMGVDWIRSNETWALSGLRFPGDEPELWIRQKALEVNDRPRIDARAWRVSDGRHVAAVVVESAPIKPIATPGGRVIERVGASDQPVNSPAAIKALVERGEKARTDTAERARLMYLRMVHEAIDQPSLGTFGLGLSAAGRPPELAERVWSEPFLESFRAAVRSLGERVQPAAVQIRTVGSELWGWLGDASDRGFSIRVTPDGTVGVGLRDPEEQDIWSSSINGDLIGRAWRVADSLLQQLGGYGPAALGLYIFVPANAQHLVTAWTSLGSVDDDLPRIKTELRRIRGGA